MSIMQLVKKKKGKKRPGYRGDDAAKADRAARSEGRASMGRADERGGVDRGGGDGGNKFTEFTKQNLNPQVDTITQKFTGRSPFFGGANRFGYTNVRPDGSFQPGFGGRVFGGLLSLLTGIPFVGGAIGSMYDKGTGLFDQARGFFRRGPNYNDMSQFNRLGLFGIPPGTLDEEDKISDTSFTLNDPNAIVPGGILDNVDIIEDIDVGYDDPAFQNNLMAFNPGTILDSKLKNMYSGYQNLGITNPQMIDLMKQDIEQNKQEGTPLSLPKKAYSLIG